MNETNNDNGIQDKLALGLRARRILNGLTQEALAQVSGVSESTIRRIEQRQRPPTMSTLIRLTRALHCSVDDLVKYDGIANKYTPGKAGKTRRRPLSHKLQKSSHKPHKKD